VGNLLQRIVHIKENLRTMNVMIKKGNNFSRMGIISRANLGRERLKLLESL